MMAIEFNVNGSIKSAKDIFVGVDSTRRRIVKILTSVNNDKKTIYEYLSPATISGFYYVDKNDATRLVNTQDFETYETVFTGGTIHSIIQVGNKLYCWEKNYISNYKTVILYMLHRIEPNGTITSTACTYSNFPSRSTTDTAGMISKITYFNGKFYAIIRSRTGSRAYTYALFSSDDGVEWTWIQDLSSSTSYLLGCIGDASTCYVIYSSNSSSTSYALSSVNPTTKTRTVLVSGTSSYPQYSIGVEVSETELLTRPVNYDSYTTYSVKYSNGTVTATSVTSPCQELLEFDGTHYYGAYDVGNNRKTVFYNNTQLYNILSGNFSSMCVTDDGVMIFDANSNRYKVDKNGNVTSYGATSVVPFDTYSMYQGIVYVI